MRIYQSIFMYLQRVGKRRGEINGENTSAIRQKYDIHTLKRQRNGEE
jgi:hypothetical protein